MAVTPRRSPPFRRTAHEALRIHIQNAPPAPDGLTLERTRLEEALRSRKTLGRREYSISVDDGAEQLPPDLDAEIILTLAKIDVAKAHRAVPNLKWVQTTFAGVEGMLENLVDPKRGY